MLKRFAALLTFTCCIFSLLACASPKLKRYTADNAYFQYVGRIDASNKAKPRFYSPGVYIIAKFKGTACTLLINDEQPDPSNRNYIEVVIDGRDAKRIRLTDKINELEVANGLRDGEHTILICKDTESGMGYLEFVGLECQKLLAPPPLPDHKIEYIGDSITAGASSDPSDVPCGQGQWYDQHNAYMSYGAITARNLNAQYHITAVAGIGLIHSCCDMDIVFPQVFDKLHLRNNAIPWDVKRYQPDVVTICLGQNDGEQDSVRFCSAYVKLIGTVRSAYPRADIVCLSSPMAGGKLLAMLKRYLTGVAAAVNAAGDKKVTTFFFDGSYNSGCAAHPDVREHGIIASQLTAYLHKLKGW